ncbi:MAG: hypothetical protein VX519_01705 [Myxococcota bacterium]|nr:hypothetical protein [Myxococcota bacterium]
MLYWLLLPSCAPTLEACDDMCRAAANAQEACLSEWGSEWEDLGYVDRSDYLNSCDTWAWEMHLLEKDARVPNAPNATEEICLDRQEWLDSNSFTCESWQDVDWNETPWSR